MLRKHIGEESPRHKALSRGEDIRAESRPNRHQPGQQDRMEKLVDWEDSDTFKESQCGWNSGDKKR